MIVVAAFVALLALAGPASAGEGNDGREVSGKPVTVCHATGSASNPYVKLENVQLVQFLNPVNGHVNHEGDIWAPFSYIVRTGPEQGDYETVNVAGQGDQSLLAFEDCKKPREDTPVTKPEPVFQDLCGTKNDTFSVAGGQGFTVGAVQIVGGIQRIVVTLAEGFKWADGTTAPLVFERNIFTNVPCDLPETGGSEYASTAGYASLAGVAVVGGLMLLRRRRVDA